MSTQTGGTVPVRSVQGRTAEKRSSPLKAWVTPEIHEIVTRVGVALGISQSEIVNEAITLWLRELKRGLDNSP